VADLLPCPFCGGKAFLEHEHDGDMTPWSYIKCGSCNVRTSGAWATDPCPLFYEAVRAGWNRRASGKTECRVVGAVPADVAGLIARAEAMLAIPPNGWKDKFAQDLIYELIAALRGRVVGGKDVAGLRERLRAASGRDWGECERVAHDALALLEGAAPPDLAVGREQSQHDAESRASLSTPVPLTKEPREHVASMDCWCGPTRDSVEPSVIIHHREH
jgi:hypothetical protein